MDSKDFQKYLPNFSNSQWFLVQYDQEPQKFTRKVVQTDDLIWNEELQNIGDGSDGRSKEHVLIRDLGRLHLGHIVYRSHTQQECIEHHSFLQMICMQVVGSSFYTLISFLYKQKYILIFL